MSKRITLDDDEIKLIHALLKDAIGQRDNFNVQLGRVADVTYQRLLAKLSTTPTTEPQTEAGATS